MCIKNVRFANGRWRIPVDRYLLLIVFVFSCPLRGQSNGNHIQTTLSSDRDSEPPTSPDQNSGPSMYSRYWVSHVSVLLPKLTDDNQDDSQIHDDRNSSPGQSLDRRESISSPNPSPDRRQSISSHDQRLSPPLNYNEAITHTAHPSPADMGSASSSDSDLRVKLSAHKDPGVSSWRTIDLHDQEDSGHESPMILFDENGEMHTNYYTSSMGYDNRNK